MDSHVLAAHFGESEPQPDGSTRFLFSPRAGELYLSDAFGRLAEVGRETYDTLVAIGAEHRLTLEPKGGGWRASGAGEAAQCPTIADAVRTCVARIKEKA